MILDRPSGIRSQQKPEKDQKYGIRLQTSNHGSGLETVQARRRDPPGEQAILGEVGRRGGDSGSQESRAGRDIANSTGGGRELIIQTLVSSKLWVVLLNDLETYPLSIEPIC